MANGNGVASDYYPELPVDVDPRLSEAMRIAYDHIYQLRDTLQRERKERAPIERALTPGSAEFNTLREQLLANFPATALNVTTLLGVLSEPQKAGIPIVTALPDVNFALDGEVVSFNNILYIFDTSASTPGTWKVLSTAGIVIVDTHAQRVAVATPYPPADFPSGTLFYETDRTVLYRRGVDGSSNPAWIFTLGEMVGTVVDPSDTRPVDLGTNGEDVGFKFRATDFGVTYEWSQGSSTWGFIAGEGRFVLTMTANTTVADPTSVVAPPGTILDYFIIQDGIGGHVISWDSVFKGVSDLTVDRTADTVTTVRFIVITPTFIVLMSAVGGIPL